MIERHGNEDDEGTRYRVNPGYAFSQLSKALTTSEKSVDESVRERALARAARWQSVIANLQAGTVDYGSRTPLRDVPAWATLEVVTGGFATGSLLAGGPLEAHEKALLEDLADQVPEGAGRRALNLLHLTDEGLTDLEERLRTGRFDVVLPEEGALAVVAWLLAHDHADLAVALLGELEPYFDQLRFYPVPSDRTRRGGSRVYLQDVGTTIGVLEAIAPKPSILAQKESVDVWGPFNDRVVALFLETVQDDWPCQTYPHDWTQRAWALIGEYAILRREHANCGKPDRPKGHAAQLRDFLARTARDPAVLTGKEVGRIREILRRHVARYGEPGTAQCARIRGQRQSDVASPTFDVIAAVVVGRLAKHARDDGLDDVTALGEDVTADEGARYGLAPGTRIPETIQAKARRCHGAAVDRLVEVGLITSADTLAVLLPRVTSEIRAAGIADPTLRRLYAAIYQAFRKRRSLLLLDLQSQVRIEELPWVSVIDAFRDEHLPDQELARQTLEDVATLAITSFPQAILPNKLVQEFRALVKGANLDVPFVDEIAADIFRGRFSQKFPEAARRAGDLLQGTLYARYYAIDFDLIPAPPAGKPGRWKLWFGGSTDEPVADRFARLCAERAGVTIGTWDPAINGMIIEQQQILTTQNLATLFQELGLTDSLRSRLPELAERCFSWICKRLQVRQTDVRANLIVLKNAAYAWRQMIFFLALLPDEAIGEFLVRARASVAEEPEEFRSRFRPALDGLLAAAGEEGRGVARSSTRPFLGWSKERHWLMPEQAF